MAVHATPLKYSCAVLLLLLVDSLVCCFSETPAVASTDDAQDCRDRDDRWVTHGTTCAKMKRLCKDDGYGQLVRSWCPKSCGICISDEKTGDDSSQNEAEQAQRNGTVVHKGPQGTNATRSWNWSDTLGPKDESTSPASKDQFTRALPLTDRLKLDRNLSNASCPEGSNLSNDSSGSAQAGVVATRSTMSSALDNSFSSHTLVEKKADGQVNSSRSDFATASASSGVIAATGGGSAAAGNTSGRFDLRPSLLEDLEDVPFVGPLLHGSGRSLPTHPVKTGNRSFHARVAKVHGSNGTTQAVNQFFNAATSHARNLSILRNANSEPAAFDIQLVGGEAALASLGSSNPAKLNIDFSLDDESVEPWKLMSDGLSERLLQKPAGTEVAEEEKACPLGYERVAGDVYGGDQWTGNWKHSADSIEDCAWRCLRQPGCGSFEYSPSKKKCFRNSQTRPTSEQDRGDFVFCRRRPCPSFKTEDSCLGHAEPAGHYSKEISLRPGSYCIWSAGACQAPMACTDNDCFLPDGGLPGMELPSRYTLWISKAGLQATMLPK
ncbi:unnamed protein product [Polarella glacialis]|uniref:Apple domain-containing protein n=1 Tax=Polarella glacialis TaxID=89957 RepID=A0A813GP15_POLGL|nr:unnamed protein product [Polarella glacialis]